jgi:hypothetical protein
MTRMKEYSHRLLVEADENTPSIDGIGVSLLANVIALVTLILLSSGTCAATSLPPNTMAAESMAATTTNDAGRCLQ